MHRANEATGRALDFSDNEKRRLVAMTLAHKRSFDQRWLERPAGAVSADLERLPWPSSTWSWRWLWLCSSGQYRRWVQQVFKCVSQIQCSRWGQKPIAAYAQQRGLLVWSLPGLPLLPDWHMPGAIKQYIRQWPCSRGMPAGLACLRACFPDHGGSWDTDSRQRGLCQAQLRGAMRSEIMALIAA